MLKIAWAPEYTHPLPPGHRFPMEKYALLPEQLRYEGTVGDENFFYPEKLTETAITAVHTQEYWEKLKGGQLSRKEARATGFPQSDALVHREVLIAGGSVQAAHFACAYGIGINSAGGTHHAFRDRGEGFCLLNDIALTASYLLTSGRAQKILVVDLDVHQGNGTAAIFQGEPAVFTFSMHGEKNYPHRKECSDLDIELPDGTGDVSYLKILRKVLPSLLERVEPDFLIYQCGVDVLETDTLGRLSLSLEGVKQRERLVLESAKLHAIPIMCCMGGGYSPQIRDILEAHAHVYRLAQELFF